MRNQAFLLSATRGAVIGYFVASKIPDETQAEKKKHGIPVEQMQAFKNNYYDNCSHVYSLPELPKKRLYWEITQSSKIDWEKAVDVQGMIDMVLVWFCRRPGLVFEERVKDVSKTF